MSELKDYDVMDIEAMDDKRLEKSKSGKIQATRVYIKAKVDSAIADLKAKLEDAQATAYAESVDAGMRERRLKHALWLARAERAKEMCRRLLIQGFDPKWENVERKCRAKAKEYK